MSGQSLNFARGVVRAAHAGVLEIRARWHVSRYEHHGQKLLSLRAVGAEIERSMRADGTWPR